MFDVPKERRPYRQNLCNLVNEAVHRETDNQTNTGNSLKKRTTVDPLQTLANRVSSKLEEGDFHGAIRIASSSTKIAPENLDTLEKLKEKHPSPHPSSDIPSLRANDSINELDITPSVVRKAVFAFPAGSAGGPDGLRPQHLKDIMRSTKDDLDSTFLSALTAFIGQVVAGNVPQAVRPHFFGATLIGLSKEDGGVRPIAIGCTLRRLAAKCVTSLIKEEMGSLLRPTQLGYGTCHGAEAVAHASRTFLSNLGDQHVMVKLDYTNAFNTVRRDKMLMAVLKNTPGIYPFVHSVYSQSTNLYFGHCVIPSSEGVQQGDPLGPLLFCLSILDMISRLTSIFKAFYLDDGTLGGPVEDVLRDLRFLIEASKDLDLNLNTRKSEIISDDESAVSTMISAFPSLTVVISHNAMLLGSPIGGDVSVDSAIGSNIHSLQTLGDRLKLLHAHDALTLLRNAFTMPKILYILRTAPCFWSTLLEDFDSIQRSLLEGICNIQLNDDSWMQAALPINAGGLGIRSAAKLAPSAYLASAAGCATILQTLLPDVIYASMHSLQHEAITM